VVLFVFTYISVRRVRQQFRKSRLKVPERCGLDGKFAQARVAVSLDGLTCLPKPDLARFGALTVGRSTVEDVAVQDGG